MVKVDFEEKVSQIDCPQEICFSCKNIIEEINVLDTHIQKILVSVLEKEYRTTLKNVLISKEIVKSMVRGFDEIEKHIGDNYNINKDNVEKVKINNNPKDLVSKEKSEYDKYLENGIFNFEKMTEYLNIVENNNKNYFIRLEHTIRKGWLFRFLYNALKNKFKRNNLKIEFLYNYGTVIVKMGLNVSLRENVFEFDKMSKELGMEKEESFDKLTKFSLRYSDYTFLNFNDLEHKISTKEDLKFFKSKKRINPYMVLFDAYKKLNKIKQLEKTIK